jgi:hypothetical protein
MPDLVGVVWDDPHNLRHPAPPLTDIAFVLLLAWGLVIAMFAVLVHLGVLQYLYPPAVWLIAGGLGVMAGFSWIIVGEANSERTKVIAVALGLVVGGIFWIIFGWVS